MREVQFRDAKANLSEVVDEAIAGKPVVIVRDGRKQAVVLSYDEWRRLSQVYGFGRLLMGRLRAWVICRCEIVQVYARPNSDCRVAPRRKHEMSVA